MEKISALRPYTKVRARFQPKRTDDLKPDALPFIGREGIFEVLWQQDEGDAYEGEWVLHVPQDWEPRTFVWVPESDLTDVVEVTAPA